MSTDNVNGESTDESDSDTDSSVPEEKSENKNEINKNKSMGKGEKKEKHDGDDDEEEQEEEEEEEEDDLVKAITAVKQKPKEHPPDIEFEDLIIDISFHPSTNIVAAASVVGDALLYKYTNDGNELINTFELHKNACRDIEFNDDGSVLYSCGKDKNIMITDTATGKLKRFYEDAHENALYSLYVFDENIICTGDEEGIVKVWDVRLKNAVMSFNHMEEFVSDMTTTEDKKFLVCSSGDGTITSFNMRSKKMFVQSEGYDAELNCLQLLKHESKLLTCSSKGKMYIFNWGQFGYHSDEYHGPKYAINSVLGITENIVVAGYEDGNIRAVNLFPHQHLGIVGQHRFSVEALDISHDGEFIASVSLDQKLQFWNIRYFEDLFVKKKKRKKTEKKSSMSVNLPSSRIRNPSDFFADLK